jgi:hypothetical protein
MNFFKQKILFLVFVFIFLFDVENQAKLSSAPEIKLKIHNKEEDLFEFIRTGKETIKKLDVEKKAIMVLGLPGSGKNTLVNYLNHVPLKCFFDKRIGKWLVKIDDVSKSLSGGFAIGHKISSETLIPASYTPPNSNFSYIGYPGFGDKRAIEIEMASNIFRNEITKGINLFKFLILIPHDDLIDKGIEFRNIIRFFSQMFGCFNNESCSLKMIKSLAFIVSRVSNNGLADDEIKETLTNKLLEIIDDEKNATKLGKNEELVFRGVLNNSRIEIFSNPKKTGLVDEEQKFRILELVEKMDFINKEDANFQNSIKVSREYQIQVNSYIKSKHSSLLSDINFNLSEKIEIFYNKKIKLAMSLKDFTNLYNELDTVFKITIENLDLNQVLLKINGDILDEKEKSFLKITTESIKEMSSFMSKENQDEKMFETQWLYNAKLKIFIENNNNTILKFFKSELSKFDKDFVSKMKKDFFSRLTNVNSFIELREVKSLLTKYVDDIQERQGFDIFLHDVIDWPLLMQEEYRKKGFNTEAFNELKDFALLFEELNECYFNYTNHVLTLKGNFMSMSSVLEDIAAIQYMYLLIHHHHTYFKSIRIFSSHLFVFNTDFKLSLDLYQTNFPDLIVIAPKIVVERAININLTCERIPDYPDKKPKASSGRFPGGNGEDGKPGEPGFNGGNLLIIADYFLNSSLISFESMGGRGGPGQNG